MQFCYAEYGVLMAGKNFKDLDLKDAFLFAAALQDAEMNVAGLEPGSVENSG